MTFAEAKTENRPQKTKRKKRLLAALLCLLLISTVLVFLLVPFFIRVNGGQTVTVEVNTDYDDPGATNILTGAHIDGTGYVDTGSIGAYTLTYSWLLQHRYRTVIVADTIAPEIELVGRDVITPVGEEYADPGVVVTDNYDADLTAQVKVSDNVDAAQAGEYSIVYTVSDSSGNTASVERQVLVVEDDFSYCREVKNLSENDQALLLPITDFLDRYYRSLKYLQYCEFSDLFASGAFDQAYLGEAAAAATVDYRSQVENDLRMDDCSYAIDITGVERAADGSVNVSFTEDMIMKYRFLNGTESRQTDLANSFTLREEEGGYVIAELHREEGPFQFFMEMEDASDRAKIDQLRERYVNSSLEAQKRYEEEKAQINTGAVCPEPNCAHPYDRDKAGAYAVKYALTRNGQYGDFESNCVNYVSQCIHAGGVPMDGVSPHEWKFFSNVHDEESADAGYTASWIYIPMFADYMRNGDIVTQEDIWVYFAQPGDVIVMLASEDKDISESPHVVIVSECVTDADGNLLDILYCGNTNDQLNLPLSSTAAPSKKLLKIYGYN